MPTRPSSQPLPLRTRALWDKLVEAFREQPGNFAHAARHSGVSRKAARVVWEKGWARVSWARPIKAVIREEGDEAQLAAAAARTLDDLMESGAGQAVLDLAGFQPDELADLLAAVQPVDEEAAAMETLGADPPSAGPAEERPRRYLLEVAFPAREERDRARGALEALGDGSLDRGLTEALRAHLAGAAGKS